MKKANGNLALVINIDGASSGNPGPSGIGVIIKDASDGQVVCEFSEYHGEMTNNAVEYRALIRALEYAIILRARTVTIRSDSQLLVRQMTGEYRVKSPNIGPLHRWAADLVRVLDRVDFESVRRENNKDADALAQQSLKGVSRRAGRAAAFRVPYGTGEEESPSSTG